MYIFAITTEEVENEYKNGNILLVTSEPHWSLRDVANDLVGEWIHMQASGNLRQ